MRVLRNRIWIKEAYKIDERYHEELNNAANTLCEFCDNDDCRSCGVALLMDYAEGLY